MFHTVGYLVPVLNIFVVYWLWRDLSELRVRVGLPDFPVAGYTVGAIFLAPVFFCLVSPLMNEYWDVRLQGWAHEAPVTTIEKVIVGIGIAIWALWLLLFVLLIALAIGSGAQSG